MRDQHPNRPDTAQYDIQVYKDQLAEVDRDLARDVLEAEDAERVRTEIARRILAADSAATAEPSATSSAARPVLLTLSAITLIGGGLLIYAELGAPGYGDVALADRIAQAETFRANRPSQAQAEAELAEQSPPPAPVAAEAYTDLVAQLRSVVAERQEDAEGWRLLAISEANLGNYTQAYAALARHHALIADTSPGALTDMADLMISAAGGYVSPEAEAYLAQALEQAPSYGPARYYWGLMQAQTGRPDHAFRTWDHVLRQGPADAPWIPPIQAQIDDLAARAGVSYVQPAPGSAVRGPSAEALADAQDLSPSERMEMIGGMVDGLADRLSTTGGTAEEWAQLIVSLGVLGRFNEAMLVYENALEVFAEDLTAIDHITRAADQAGVAN